MNRPIAEAQAETRKEIEVGINMNEAFPSKWLKADDIERETIVTIQDVTMETIGDDERKPVVWFQGYDKGMVMNKTNANNVSALYGPDTDAWLGKAMLLTTAMVDFQGRSTRALRLYPPPRQQSRPAPQQNYAQASGGNPAQYDERNPPPPSDNEYARNFSAG